MRNLKILFKRLFSRTPPFLAKIRNLCLAVSAGALAGLAILNQYPEHNTYASVFVKIAVIATSVASGLQLSTTNKTLSKEP